MSGGYKVVLSDIDIKDRIYKDKIVQPFIEDNLQPCSLDLTLDDKLLIPTVGKEYDIDDEIKTFKVGIEDHAIEPGEFVLANTKEWVEIPNDIAGEVAGRSTMARMGLEVHLTAGWIDAGFKGNITLEIVNNSGNTIQLKEGARIAQLILHKLSSKVENEYNGKYQNSKGVVANRSEEVVEYTKKKVNASKDVKLNPDDVERDLGSDCEGDGICPVR